METGLLESLSLGAGRCAELVLFKFSGRRRLPQAKPGGVCQPHACVAAVFPVTYFYNQSIIKESVAFPILEPCVF